MMKKNYKDPWYKRLEMDLQLLTNFCENSPLVEFKGLNGSDVLPPSEYEVTYKVKSIVGINEDQSPIYGEEHKVKIILPQGYPMLSSPSCYATTKTWHPNIRSSGKFEGHICINAHVLGFWHTLDLLVEQIGEMLQYKNYHAEQIQPYPEDPIVAKWIKNYAEPNEIVDKSKGIATDSRPLMEASNEWENSRNQTNKINILDIRLKSSKTPKPDKEEPKDDKRIKVKSKIKIS